MIRGAKYWNEKKYHLIQTDNPTDSLLRKVLKKFDPYYLETCGPTAACCCLLALGYNLTVQTPGGYIPQPEEILQDWMNDPVTLQLREQARKGVNFLPGNRVPQFYPAGVKACWNAKGVFSRNATDWDKVRGWLTSGKAVQLCLKKPGHYIAAVAYDEDAREIVYNDPWPERRGLKNRGFNERISREEYLKNIQWFCIIYSL